MSPKKSLFVCFFSLSLFVGHAQKKLASQNNVVSKPLFSDVLLLKHIKTLSSDAFEGRQTGTRGGVKARRYIISEFQKLQVVPLHESFEQPFSFSQGKVNYNASNILGFIKGTQEPKKYIVLSAHYDHLGIKQGAIYNGADDDASGVGALFSFAEYLKSNPPKHSIILIAFDSEELGLQGSKYYVNHPIVPLKNIMVDLNMDMVSRSDANQLFVVGTQYNKTLQHLIVNFKQPDTIKLLIGHNGEDNLENWTYSSDHASFHKKGIPFLYFGVEDHNDYHMPTDDYENIQPKFYTEAVKSMIRVFKKIDSLNF